MPILRYKGPKVHTWTAQAFLGLFDSLCSGDPAEFIKLLGEPPLKIATEALIVEVRDLKLERFLKVVVSMHKGEPSTVRDLIGYFRNTR
jgi:hypothetical protein